MSSFLVSAHSGGKAECSFCQIWLTHSALDHFTALLSTKFTTLPRSWNMVRGRWPQIFAPALLYKQFSKVTEVHIMSQVCRFSKYTFITLAKLCLKTTVSDPAHCTDGFKGALTTWLFMAHCMKRIHKHKTCISLHTHVHYIYIHTCRCRYRYIQYTWHCWDGQIKDGISTLIPISLRFALIL